MKKLLITSIGLCIFTLYLPGQTKQGTQTDKQAPQPESQPPVSITFINNPAPDQHTESTRRNAPRWYTAPEWWLVIAAIPTLIFVGVQAFQTRNAAQAAQVSANATKLSTDVLINAERAWVEVSIADFPVPTPDALGVFILPTVKNYGKTVGSVVKFCIQHVSVRSPENLPPEPEYRKEREVEASFILPPNVPLQPMSVGIPQHEFQDAVDTKSALYVYGYIDYIILEKDRKQTRFCLMYYSQLASFGLPKPGFYIGVQAPQAYKRQT